VGGSKTKECSRNFLQEERDASKKSGDYGIRELAKFCSK